MQWWRTNRRREEEKGGGGEEGKRVVTFDREQSVVEILQQEEEEEDQKEGFAANFFFLFFLGLRHGFLRFVADSPPPATSLHLCISASLRCPAIHFGGNATLLAESASSDLAAA